MLQEFTDATFKSEVLESDKITVVDLWAEWCGPCRLMSPVMEELAKDNAGKAVVIGKLNVDDNPEIPTNYSVRGIPTFLIFKGGELKDRVIGAQSKKVIQDKIDALL